jgi:hypothetical protein
VRTAVTPIYAGAAVSAVGLIIGLSLIIAGIKAAARGRFWGYSVTAPQIKPARPRSLQGGAAVTAAGSDARLCSYRFGHTPDKIQGK